MTHPQQIYDREKLSLDIVRFKKGGENFEVILSDPDSALLLRQGKESIDVADILQSEHVFKDAKKGELASEPKMQTLFGTSKATDVARLIILNGEFHLTAEQKEKILERKRLEVIDYIHMHAMDPHTRLPHPKKRIELALEEAKARIDPCNTVHSQLDKIINELRPILPMSFESFHIRVGIPARHASRAYSILKSKYKILGEKWLNDGSLQFELKALAGIKTNLYDMLGKLAQGEAQIEEVKEA